jgi:uncharacterized membrane protein
MVIDAIRSQGCRKVGDVVNVLQRLDRSITLEDIRNVINDLKDDNNVTLSEPRFEGTFVNYIRDISNGASLWTTVLVSLITLTTIYFTPGDGSWPILRMGAGAVFTLFMPGYALAQLLFIRKYRDTVECISLSLGLSLAVTPLIGLLLNYSPWGIQLVSIVVSLTILSIGFAIGGAYRAFLHRKR